MKIRGNQVLRRLDGLFGKALIFLLRIFKKQRPFPNEVRTIGVLKLTGIGDFVLLSGLLQDIRQKYPRAKILLFCGADNACLSSMIPSVDEVIPLSVKKPFRSIRRLRKSELSCFIDFGQWSRIEALFSFFSKSQYRIGFQTEGQERHFLYDAVSLHGDHVHEIENYRALAKRAGVQSSSSPSLFLKELEDSFKFRSLLCEKTVLFHLWPSGYLSYLKEWPLGSWVELGRLLLAKGYHILLSGSQNNFSANEKIVAMLGSSQVHNLAGKISFDELGHLVQNTRCVVSVNTGIMHFAACFTGHLIVLHGPTSVLRWGPLHSSAISISSEDKESGYLNLGFEYPRNPSRCMEKISVQKVVEALNAHGV